MEKAVVMLLSHLNRFIYTKTFKTAGTSVEIYFEDACVSPNSIVHSHEIEETVTPAGVIGYRGVDVPGNTWYNHMSARIIRDHVGDIVWNDYFKFCVVRNPFDKLVSFWWFTMTQENRNYYKEAEFTDVRSHFSRWAVEHASDAVDRDKYMIDGNVCMDFFIRYESLLDGLQSVCQRIGYPFRPDCLGKYKSGIRCIRQPFCDYFDKSAIAAVQTVFGWEFDYFGYGLLPLEPREPQ